jgi:ribosomal protein S3AE
MSKKDWLDFKAPAPFDSKSFGKTCITKTTGTRIATELIKGRVVEASLADFELTQINLLGEKLNNMLKMWKEDSQDFHFMAWI